MPSWKLWLRRGLAAVVLLIVVIASLLAGLLLPYLVAAWSAKIWFLAVSSVCAFAIVASAGAWLATLIWRSERRAAQNLLPQPEAQQLLVPFIAPAVGTLVCKGDRGQVPPLMRGMSSDHVNPHLNPLVLQSLILSTGEVAHNPHSSLQGNKTPAMILFGECDYLPWSGALDYRKTLANAKVYYIPKAGHFIVFEQSELMGRMIVAFLLDQPEVVAPYAGDEDPRQVAHSNPDRF